MTQAAGAGARVWLGPAAALVIGLPILMWGLLAPSSPVLPWFVPVADGLAVVGMLIVLLMASMDAALRHDRRALPIACIATATAVMWVAHFVMFPGDVPAIQGPVYNQATSTIFLSINLGMPLMLSIALLQRGGELRNASRGIAIAVGLGLVIGAAVVVAALLFGTSLETVTLSGEFNVVDSVVGIAGLIPAVFGLVGYAFGLRGDERIAGGVLAALTFTALNSISLVFLTARYTPSWYADHVLALLPFAALVAGQLWLYNGSVVSERRATIAATAAAERRRIGLDIAKAMAVETQLPPVIGRLLSGVAEALDADSVTLLRLLPEGFVIESSVDRQGTAASVGTRLPLEAVVAAGRSVVQEAVRDRRPLILGSYQVNGLDGEGTKTHSGITQSIVMPLVRAGEVYGVLIAGRRTDVPFATADVEQLEELGAIAALLIRNARLLDLAEANSRAKSYFMSLVGHELRTPISVVRGYADLLGKDALGPLTPEQRGPVSSIHSKTSELAERVDQLLVAARLDSIESQPDVEPASVDLNEVARAALQRATDRRRLINAHIRLDAPAGPVLALGNAADLGTILDNLLNNAMTYSRPPADITVQVRDGKSAELRVIDAGIGIAESETERIFEQFYRVDDGGSREVLGSGLGLYISRRLAERWGGQLYLEMSRLGEGSVFVLRLKHPPA